jgi:hypothetical protein
MNQAKGGNAGRNGGDALVVDIVSDDFQGDNLVQSTCAGDSQASYLIRFGDTDQGTNQGCLVVTTSSGAQLVDGIEFTVGVRSGAVTKIQIWGHDAAGPSGIYHNSDPIPIVPGVPVSPEGFRVHVHATDVPVWRMNGHLSTKRVAQVGTVDIGDLVYRLP